MANSTSRYSLLFLTLLSITTQITLVQAIQRPITTNTYTEFIKTSCKATTYPELCYNSLSTRASDIQTSPQLLANAALTVTLDTTSTTLVMMARISKGAGMSRRKASAMRDCMEVLNDSVDELKNSIKEMGEMKSTKNHALLMNDVQTWVSAALTDEDTCMQGFGGKAMDGKLKTVIRGKIMTICHLTSNSLALINAYASLLG